MCREMEIFLITLSALSLAASATALFNLASYRKKVNALVSSKTGVGMDEVLSKLEEYQKISARLEGIESRLNNSVSKVGVIRYNPFADTGGDLSFALALLNDNLD